MNDGRGQSGQANPLRRVPSVDALLQQESITRLIDRFGRTRVAGWVRASLDEVRATVPQLEGVTRERLMAEAERFLHGRAERESAARLDRVINATGVILHTNLGRAPLADAAVDALHAAARYANLEVDLLTGARGVRGGCVEQLWRELTGAEAALVVNNCAAATLLVLQSLAAGREVVISRGQLIEIGGSYRLPDVFAASGAILREVGTTNRTRLSDYEAAVSDQTAALLRVHSSNYRISGFSEEVAIGPLVDLAHQRSLIAIDDLGSGCLYDLSEYGLHGEPLVKDSLNSGADLVLFSGDKLLGGPQAGVILGRRELIERMRRNPLARAVRVDKLTLAAMQATLEIHLAGRAFTEIPVLRMIAAPAADLRARAEALAAALCEWSAFDVDVVTTAAAIGGGSLPDQTLESSAVALAVDSAEELAARLRTARPAVLPRIEQGRVLLDLRTVEPDQDALLAERLGTENQRP